MDEVQLYSRALSDADVLGLYGTTPTFTNTLDIGGPNPAGSYSETGGVITMTAGGADIWGTADHFRFAYLPITGNTTITARVVSLANIDPWSKAGAMIRNTTDAGSANVMMLMTPSTANGASFQWRSSLNGNSSNSGFIGIAPSYWIRLVRSGNTFTAYRSPDNVIWYQLGASQTITMNSTALVGLAVTSHLDGTAAAAVFYNISIIGAQNVGPTIATAAAASPNPVTTGTTTNLSVLGADDGAESNLTYTWSTVGLIPGALSAADFQFTVGNDSNPGGWTTAPAPASVTVNAGGGTGGSDRVTIVWADYAFENQWLQVTVLATANTGLSSADVFYFGNAVGESGDNPADAVVNLQDEINARTNKTGFTAAAITNLYDYNRDGKVNAADDLIARHNTSGPALQLISAPTGGALAGSESLQPLSATLQIVTLAPTAGAEVITTTEFIDADVFKDITDTAVTSETAITIETSGIRSQLDLLVLISPDFIDAKVRSRISSNIENNSRLDTPAQSSRGQKNSLPAACQLPPTICTTRFSLDPWKRV